ncbi:hypothetical protein NDU88_007594 [Pleurodeles waltl]|uniref:Uncharacterized protein n=1 Tax=Pleurodeles waltl TaxID=8319 RepID=A0AAV7QSC9_PLEWA|nr:hypothetical protein NDU88_007594 [Pleurodeles waltl]
MHYLIIRTIVHVQLANTELWLLLYVFELNWKPLVLYRRVPATQLQDAPTGPGKQSAGGAFPHPEVPSSDVDPGVEIKTPEEEEPARRAAEGEELTRTHGGKNNRTETPGEEGQRRTSNQRREDAEKERAAEAVSPRDSACHVPGGKLLSKRLKDHSPQIWTKPENQKEEIKQRNKKSKRRTGKKIKKGKIDSYAKTPQRN